MDARTEPRQRWRLVVARAADAPALGQRETIDAWEAAIDASGLPVARTSASPARARISFGAPLAVGMAAGGELIDLFLTERLPRWQVREALTEAAVAVVPVGWSLVDLADVWLGGPALAGIVAAADYRITVEGAAASAAAASAAAASAAAAPAVATACEALIAASALPRSRDKGGGAVTYDMRPLLVDVGVIDDGPPVVLRARTRFHATLGTGRPEEVVAALADQLSLPLTIADIVRERLLLADDLA